MHTLDTLVLLGQLYSSTAPFPLTILAAVPTSGLGTVFIETLNHSDSSQHHFSHGTVTSSVRKSLQCVHSMCSGAQGVKFSWNHFPLHFTLLPDILFIHLYLHWFLHFALIASAPLALSIYPVYVMGI